MSAEIVLANYCLGGKVIGLELTADDRGLTACRLLPALPRVELATGNRFLRQGLEELAAYFAGLSQHLKTYASPDGTEFQLDVWKATATIPYGQVRSYGWLAAEIGRPKAVRAVAQALGANPLLLYVPCHRVVSSTGQLGGFSCGVEWKVLLLEREGLSGPAFPVSVGSAEEKLRQSQFLL